jgi:hypothetical protein
LFFLWFSCLYKVTLITKQIKTRHGTLFQNNKWYTNLILFYIRETAACQPIFPHLLSESSCDFTKDFCNYSRPKSPLKWIRLNKGQSHWSGIKVPERNRTESG